MFSTARVFPPRHFVWTIYGSFCHICLTHYGTKTHGFKLISLTFGFVSDTNKGMQDVNEMVGVDVSFWGSRVVPTRFVWDGRRHDVKRINMKFERKNAGRRYLCFALDTGSMLVELAMDREDLSWRVTRCAPSYT